MPASRILVVDDEDAIRQLLNRILEAKQRVVEAAEDGDIALEKIKKNIFDLLIIDLKMPRLNGMDLLKEAKKINPYIEVIIITGYPTVESAVEAIKIGAFDFICKPFDIDHIHNTVERCLEKQRFDSKFIRLTELTSLFEVSKTITAAIDLDSLLVRVIDSALEITAAKRGFLLLLDENTNKLKVKVGRGLNDVLNVPVGEDVSIVMPKEEKSMLFNNTEEGRHFLEKIMKEDERKLFLESSLVSIPLKSGEDIFGAIYIYGKISGENFTEREHALLSVLAGQAAVAIENAQLYKMLRNKIDDLQQTLERLNKTQVQLIQSEKLAAVGTFSSGIAHEVKNPLSVILSGIEFLEMKLVHLNDDIKTAILKIKESALRANNILLNLLKFARPSEMKIEKVNPEELINDTVNLLRYRAPLSNINITTEFAEDALYINVDKSQMQQVLFNILMNAIEAVPKGGEIKIKSYKTKMPEFSQNQLCIIEIIDTGEGISKENLSRLFEPFFTTKRERKGTGLGLSMSKMIIDNHQGKLVIDSELGKGTDAKIILPLVSMEE